MKFLEEHIFSRFGFPKKLVTDNPQVYKYAKLIDFCQKYNVILSHSTAYHPQGNELEESSNKTLVRILNKTIAQNKIDWDSKLQFSLWASRVTTRRSTGKSPFELVYGTKAFLPSQLINPMVALIQDVQEELISLIKGMNKFVELNETRDKARENLISYQEKMKTFFDRKVKDVLFQRGDLFLRWDVRREDKGKHGKFGPLWYGPFY